MGNYPCEISTNMSDCRSRESLFDIDGKQGSKNYFLCSQHELHRHLVGRKKMLPFT